MSPSSRLWTVTATQAADNAIAVRACATQRASPALNHGGKRAIVLDGQDFIARFLQHHLPPGFKRIRHYVLLSPALKAQKSAAARAALAMPAANTQAREDAAGFLKRVAGIDIACCPHCKLGQCRTTAILPPERAPARRGARRHRQLSGPPECAASSSSGPLLALQGTATDLFTPAAPRAVL